MRKKNKHLSIIWIMFLALILHGCVEEEYASTVAATAESNEVTTIHFCVSTGEMTTRASETGTLWENYIATYRIFLYDTDNYYIGELGDCYVEQGGNQGNEWAGAGTYDSGELAKYDNIKLVFIANWPNYTYRNTDIAPAAGSTIDDLCMQGSMGEYNTFTVPYDIKFDIEGEGYLIPFYGVVEYDNIHTEDEEANRDIGFKNVTNLIRAYAKIEVVIDDDVASSIANCYISSFNGKGMCAPCGFRHQDDYNKSFGFQEYLDAQWVSGATMSRSNYSDNTWYAYLSDIDVSTMGDSHYCYIDIVDNRGYDYRFAVASYTDGKTTAYTDGEPSDKPDRLNIIRNNLYRFSVSIVADDDYDEELEVLVTIVPWNLYENYVEY